MAKTWVALLRGINVGKAKRISMADLRALLQGMGYSDVRTVLTSGNAVFTTASGAGGALGSSIAEGIEDELGVSCQVIVLASSELAKVVDENPFVAAGVSIDELHATFLAKPPAAARLAEVAREDVAPDEFAAGGKVLYTRLPNGVMGSRLPDWEKVLGTTATARTWKTVLRLRDALS